MNFDKNQNTFPSREHNAIWNIGIHVLPIENTLTPEVRNNLPSFLVDSCEQMRNFILFLLGDMYENIELYLPLPYQLSRKMLKPFIDFGLLGEAGEESLSINRLVFEKYINKLKNSKDYDDDKKAGVSIEYRFDTLTRVGLKIEYLSESVIFTNAFFPNMFYAIREMAIAASNEKASMDNSFTYCDFRKLYKDYKYDKYENALIFLKSEQKILAKKLDEIAGKLKLTRSIKSGHCPGFEIGYNYKKATILTLNCLCSHYNGNLRDDSNNYKCNDIIMSIRLLYNANNITPVNNFFYTVENDSEELKKFVYRRIGRCRVCYDKCPTYGGRPLQIYGKTNKICFKSDSSLKLEIISIGTYFTIDDLPLIEKLLIHTKNLMDETV